MSWAKGHGPVEVEQPERCPARWSSDWTCKRERDHAGQHVDERNGAWFFAPEAPEKPRDAE